jgi:hypothetical protein
MVVSIWRCPFTMDEALGVGKFFIVEELAANGDEFLSGGKVVL